MNQPDRLHYWLAAAGSDFYGNEDKTVSTMDNPQAIQAIEFLRSLRWDARAVAPPGVEPSFIAGQAAIWEDGSWRLVEMLGRTKDGYPKVSFEWNVFPMPIGPSGKRYTLATTDGYAINRNTKHLEEAYALLKFLCGPVANQIKAQYLALQPAHRDVVHEWIDSCGAEPRRLRYRLARVRRGRSVCLARVIYRAGVGRVAVPGNVFEDHRRKPARRAHLVRSHSAVEPPAGGCVTGTCTGDPAVGRCRVDHARHQCVDSRYDVGFGRRQPPRDGFRARPLGLPGWIPVRLPGDHGRLCRHRAPA